MRIFLQFYKKRSAIFSLFTDFPEFSIITAVLIIACKLLLLFFYKCMYIQLHSIAKLWYFILIIIRYYIYGYVFPKKYTVFVSFVWFVFRRYNKVILIEASRPNTEYLLFYPAKTYSIIDCTIPVL